MSKNLYMKARVIRRVLSAVVCVALVLSLVAVGPALSPDESYAEPTSLDEMSQTAVITVTDKYNNTITVSELKYDAASKELRVSGTAVEPPYMNKDFDKFATYNYYNQALVYSGLNQANPRLAIVESGFTLDALKDYIKDQTGIPVATDSKIEFRAPGLPWRDMSALDDEPRYFYASYLMWPTMDISFKGGLYNPSLATDDPVKKNKAFDDATRSEIPIVFAVKCAVIRDIGVGNRIYETRPALDAAIAGFRSNVTPYMSLRLIRGQLSRNDKEETLGSGSIYSIDQIRITPAFHTVSNGNIVVQTAESLYATGEKVTFSAIAFSGLPTGASMPADRNRFKVLAVGTKTGEAVIAEYDAVSGIWAFTMPADDVSIRWLEPASVVVNFDANGGNVSPAQSVVISGEPFGALPVPTRDGYSFEGWWTAKSDGSEITADSIVASNDTQTLYARWTENPLTAKPVAISAVPGVKTPIAPGRTVSLPVSVTFSNGISKDVVWTSSTPKVAKVVNGKIIGVTEGKATLTATAKNDPSMKQTITIVVAKPVTKLRTPLTTVYLKKGSNLKIPICADSVNATGKADIAALLKWNTGNAKVAAVNAAGKISAKKTGRTVVTAKTLNGKSIKITVKVVAKATKLSKLSLAKKPSKLAVGKTLQLKLKTKPSTATNLNVKFKSSKPSVIKADKSGKLTALKKGKAKITVFINGKKKLSWTMKSK